MTDIKPVSKLFLTKRITIPPWIACDFVLQLKFVIAHTHGKLKTAADSLSRLDADPNEKILPEIREDIFIKPIEVIMESMDISSDEPVFNTDADLTKVQEEYISQRKNEIRKTISAQATVITNASYYHTDLPKELSILDMSFFIKLSRKLTEQNSDHTLQNFKLEMLVLLFDNQVLIIDARYMHYSQNRKRIMLKDDILYRQWYIEVEDAIQVLPPVVLLTTFLRSLQVAVGKHPIMSQMTQEMLRKY